MNWPLTSPPDHAWPSPSIRQYSRTRRPRAVYQRVLMQRRPSTTNALVVANGRTRLRPFGASNVPGCQPLIHDPVGVGRPDHPVVGPVDQHHRRHLTADAAVRRCRTAGRHRTECAVRLGRGAVRGRRVDTGRREEIRVGGGQDQRHRTARGQAGDVDPPRIDPSVRSVHQDLSGETGEDRRFPGIAALVRRVVPPPAALELMLHFLPRGDQDEARRVRGSLEARFPGEVHPRLLAAVQQQDHRRSGPRRQTRREVDVVLPRAVGSLMPVMGPVSGSDLHAEIAADRWWQSPGTGGEHLRCHPSPLDHVRYGLRPWPDRRAGTSAS